MFVFKVANSRDYGVRGEEGEREKIHEGVEDVFSRYASSREMLVMVTALTNVVTNGVRIAIPSQDILQTEGQSNDSAKNLNGNVGWSFGRKCRAFEFFLIAVSQSALKHKLLSQPHPNETPAVVDQEGIQQLSSNTLPSDQALAATIDTNSVVAMKILPLQFLPTVKQENPDEDFTEDGQVNFGCVGKGERKEKTPGGDRGKKKTTGVGISIPFEDILKPKDVVKHLNGSHSTQLACQEYGIHIWPPRKKKKLISRSFPNETPAVVDQDASLQLNSDRLSSDIQALVATVDTNSAVVKEIQPPQFLLTARQENADEDFGDDEFVAVGIGGEGTGEGEMEEAEFNSRCLGKRKRKEKTPGGKRGNKKTTGVRIGVNLEEILQTKGMLLGDAAKHLNVSRSTLKRACREHGIERWPPRKGHELSSQSRPNESPVLVDHERIPHLNSGTLPPSNQVSATRNTNGVTVKARYGKETIKFWLSWPWGTVELKQQVKKRLELKDGTYFIRYKDEANEMILIACDDDLQYCISSSSPQGTSLIEVFLEPK